jgi:hypothetical protein
MSELKSHALADGRNRLAACKIAGIEPRLVEFTGDDPLSYVVSLNLNRRHLDTSQRAVVAAKIANLKHGGDRVSEQDANLHLGVSRQAAAGMMNVSPRSVANAARVLAHGTPELVSQVELGEMAVSAAADVVKRMARPPAESAFVASPDDDRGRFLAQPYVKPADKYFAAQEAKLGPVEAKPVPKISVSVRQALVAHRGALISWGVAAFASALAVVNRYLA